MIQETKVPFSRSNNREEASNPKINNTQSFVVYSFLIKTISFYISKGQELIHSIIIVFDIYWIIALMTENKYCC